MLQWIIDLVDTLYLTRNEKMLQQRWEWDQWNEMS